MTPMSLFQYLTEATWSCQAVWRSGHRMIDHSKHQGEEANEALRLRRGCSWSGTHSSMLNMRRPETPLSHVKSMLWCDALAHYATLVHINGATLMAKSITSSERIMWRPTSILWNRVTYWRDMQIFLSIFVSSYLPRNVSGSRDNQAQMEAV